jgi:hypothetical protein
MNAIDDISDAGSIPATSTNLRRVARRSLGSDAAGPAPYGGVLVSTGWIEIAGGDRQATTLTAQTINANQYEALPMAA